MRELGVALLGCGFASRLHSRTLAKMPGVRRYYASRDGARARSYNERFSGSGHFHGYTAAIEHEVVDVVLIATPPSSHLDLTREALAAGKHVIVEKPPYLQATDFTEVADLAGRADRKVFVAENYFYKPLLQELRKTIAAGTIGEVRIISVNALKRQKTADWRDQAELSGGGAFFEGGIHWVDFMANLGLTVVDAHGYRSGPADRPDRTMVAVFTYAEGAVGTLYYSWEIGSPTRGLRLSAVHGTEGAITFESNGLLLGIRGRRHRVKVPHPRDLLGYRAMFQDFFEAIRTGQPPRYDLGAARRDLELVERIYETASTPAV
jgi:UDP-N-acetylglucosamine 3-dehydrogenase